MSTTTSTDKPLQCDASILIDYGYYDPGCIPILSIYTTSYAICLLIGFKRLYQYYRTHSTYRTASFACTAFLTGAFIFYFIRSIVILAKKEERVLSEVLMGVALIFFYSADVWVLVHWCNILFVISKSYTVKRRVKYLKWLFIFQNILVIGLLAMVAIKFTENRKAINILIICFILVLLVGYQSITWVIWREYKRIKPTDIKPSLYKEISKKMRSILIYSIATSISIVYISIMEGIYIVWYPTTLAQKIGWFTSERFTISIFGYLLTILPLPGANNNNNNNAPNNNTNNNQPTKAIQAKPSANATRSGTIKIGFKAKQKSKRGTTVIGDNEMTDLSSLSSNNTSTSTSSSGTNNNNNHTNNNESTYTTTTTTSSSSNSNNVSSIDIIISNPSSNGNV